MKTDSHPLSHPHTHAIALTHTHTYTHTRNRHMQKKKKEGERGREDVHKTLLRHWHAKKERKRVSFLYFQIRLTQRSTQTTHTQHTRVCTHTNTHKHTQRRAPFSLSHHRKVGASHEHQRFPSLRYLDFFEPRKKKGLKREKLHCSITLIISTRITSSGCQFGDHQKLTGS